MFFQMPADAGSPRRRRRASIVLLDSDNRVFLFEATDPGGHWNVPLWMIVGGGVEPGESVVDAGIRELREETGIGVESVGDCICHWDAVCPWGDQLWHFDERFYAVRVPDDRLVKLIAHTEKEKRDFPGFATRWWTAAEIMASESGFAPPDLGAVLHSYLADGITNGPIRLSGWDRTLT